VQRLINRPQGKEDRGMAVLQKLLKTGKKLKAIKLEDFRKATAHLSGDVEMVLNYEYSQRDCEEMGWHEIESVEVVEFEDFEGVKVLNINQQL
jgi:hypothetical protein